MSEPWPLLGWSHVSYDIIREGVHHHVQKCREYPKLRFIWTLDTKTNERKSRFYIRALGFDDLNEAIEAYIEKYGKPKRKRVRL
jgi:hypothetical protein